MIRAFVDDWDNSASAVRELADTLRAAGKRILWVCGCAQREFTEGLVAQSELAGLLVPFFVQNDYFGGNVDVTGLLCGCDVARALASCEDKGDVAFAAIPRVMLNADGVTLDDMDVDAIAHAAGMPVRVVSCQPSECLPEMKHEIEHGDWCE